MSIINLLGTIIQQKSKLIKLLSNDSSNNEVKTIEATINTDIDLLEFKINGKAISIYDARYYYDLHQYEPWDHVVFSIDKKDYEKCIGKQIVVNGVITQTVDENYIFHMLSASELRDYYELFGINHTGGVSFDYQINIRQ